MRRGIVGIAAFAVIATAATGCTLATTEIGLCQGDLASVEVYNYYGDHTTADHQLNRDRADLEASCRTEWAYLGVESRTFDASQLDQRSVTVLVMHREDGGTRTVWVQRLAGWQAGAALLFDTGESYFLAHQDIRPYYVASAEPISRELVPRR